LGSLHDDFVGLAGTTTQFYSVAPYPFDYRVVDEVKGKSVPLQAWRGPEGPRKLRFPDFMTGWW
jgi:hypothetical protein